MISNLFEFLAAYALWLLAFSVLSLVVASLLGVWFVAQLPADYFVFDERHPPHGNHWIIRLVLVLVKNAIGIVLIAAGLVMLFTPGQGLLTIIAGLLLANFPGKYALERWLARQSAVMAALNWLRARRGQPPFVTPE